MNTNSITSLSAGSDLQSLIAIQAADKKNSSANGGQTSAFAQMLGAASSAGSSATATTSNPSQLLNQMIASYQTTSVQNQGDSLDPMSIAA